MRDSFGVNRKGDKNDRTSGLDIYRRGTKGQTRMWECKQEGGENVEGKSRTE